MKNWIIAGILLYAATVPIFADVTSKAANGFNLEGGLDKLAEVVNTVQEGQLEALANRLDQIR